MASYLEKKGKREDGWCRAGCPEAETPGHLLLRCERYTTEREALKRRLKRKPLTLQTLFYSAERKTAVVGFLCKTGVCTAKWASEGLEEAP
jgi:hypothetical protein